MLATQLSRAEGTKQASPTSSIVSALLSAPDLNSGSYFDAPEDNRVYFNIKNATAENLYFGFDWRAYSTSSPTAQTFMYYRIMRPDGSVAVGPTLWTNTGAGKIDTYAQAVAGPNIAGTVPTGYTPVVFTPTVNGEHWIEFWRGTSNTDPTPTTSSAGRSAAPLFDLTVANKTSPYAVQNGRVFSYKWGFVAVDPSTFAVSILGDAAPDLRAYTDDRLVIRVQFNPGFQPIAYNVAVNSYGVNNSGNRVVDRRSVNNVIAPALPGGYLIFLNNPDVSLYPVATDTGNPTFGTPLFEGCAPPYNINFSLPAAGDVRILFDLNGTTGYQPGTSDRILEGYDLTAGNNVLAWDGRNGLGQLIANNVSLNLKLTYLRGRFNVPIHDAELNKNGFTISTVFPAGLPTPRLYWDDSQLTNVGTTCAGSGDNQNNTTGAGLDNSLIGSTAPSHAWNGNGNPTQIIPAPAVGGNDANTLQCDDFGNVRTINTFGWGQEKEVTTTGVLGCPDLTITKTVNNATPTIGNNVTFTVTAQNLGPNTAPGVVVNDVLPSGFTLVSATPSVGTWSAPNWNVGSLAVGATPPLTIVATVKNTGLYTNIASISSSLSDPNPNNNTAFAVVSPRGAALSVTNICPATTVNLNTQAAVTNVPSGATQTWHTATPATSLNKVANPASVGAGVYYAAFEDATTNCYSTTTAITVTIQACNADLAITKTVSNSTPLVGSNVTFTLSVLNNGASPATGVTVNDLLPSGYTYVSDNGSGAYNSNSGVWTIGNLAVSATVTLQITATVRATGIYANTATVTGGQNDPTPGNNSSTITPTPVPVSDLSVTKTDGRTTFTPGTTNTYTVVVSNAGPSTATGALVTDNAPAGTSISSWSAVFAGGATGTATGSGNISQTINVPVGGTVTYTINVAVPAGFTGNLINSATVAPPSGTTDNNTANNTATDTDTPAPIADLNITKTDNSATYTPGSPITYTVVVTNNGPSNVTGVTVNDAIPAAITGAAWTSSSTGSASVSSGATGSGNSLAATVNLAASAGNSVTFTITGTVSTAATGNLVNTATVTSPAGTTDNNTANNTATDTDTQNSQTDLAIIKSVNNSTPKVGENVTFTLLVTNNGPSAATGVVVLDQLPSGYTYVSDNGSGSYVSGTGVWTIGNLANGANTSLQITAMVNATGAYANTATVTGNENDPVPDNNMSISTPQPVVTIVASYDNLGTVASGVSVTKPLLVNDTLNGVGNFDPALVNITVTDAPNKGTASINPATGEVTYTPNAGASGIDSLVYQICDKLNPTVCDTALVVVRIEDPLLLLPKVYLQGALFGVTYTDAPANTVVDSLMRDDLRAQNLIPLTSPYGYWSPTVTDSTINASVLAVTGRNAIVDWVFVELRSASDSTVILNSRSALLQRDGDVVALDGVSPLEVRALSGTPYYVAVRHRNHLAVMTAGTIPLTPAGVVVDFRQPSTPTYLKGAAPINQAQVVVIQGRAMWAGNALRDKNVIYQGTANDVNVVSQQVLGAPGNTFLQPNYILTGYHSGDINMNGRVIFQGTRNDVEFIYQNIIKNHPGNTLKDNFFIIQQQLPE